MPRPLSLLIGARTMVFCSSPISSIMASELACAFAKLTLGDGPTWPSAAARACDGSLPSDVRLGRGGVLEKARVAGMMRAAGGGPRRRLWALAAWWWWYWGRKKRHWRCSAGTRAVRSGICVVDMLGGAACGPPRVPWVWGEIVSQ